MYILVPLPLEKQIQDLLASHRVEEALVLAKGARRNIPKEKFQVCPSIITFTVGPCVPVVKWLERVGEEFTLKRNIMLFMFSAWGNKRAVELTCTCKGCDVGRVECCSTACLELCFFKCITWKNWKQNKSEKLVIENPLQCFLSTRFSYYLLLLLKNYTLFQIRVFRFYFFYWIFSPYPKFHSGTTFKLSNGKSEVNTSYFQTHTSTTCTGV